MADESCSKCKYYLQHYVLNSRKLFRVHCGHCVLSRGKQKRPDTKACESFVPGVNMKDAFASKEYLSKELLQYVLSLELLPEIEECG